MPGHGALGEAPVQLFLRVLQMLVMLKGMI